MLVEDGDSILKYLRSTGTFLHYFNDIICEDYVFFLSCLDVSNAYKTFSFHWYRSHRGFFMNGWVRLESDAAI